MTVSAATHPTLVDLVNRQAPDGSIAALVEILNETNEILDDMVWVEGNLPTGHRTSIRTGLPAPTWRKLYGGVQPTKSTSATITDTTGMLEAYAEVDKALADLNGNTNAFRLSEDMAHIEGMNQEAADTIFFGNEGTEPEAFTGLAPRFNSLSAPNGANIIVGGGSGDDNASIWLIGWGPNTVHGIIPKGSVAGLQISDKGQVTIEDVTGSGGGRMEAYRTHYRWDLGLTVRDWRYIVRIANIDRSELISTGATGANLPNLMFEALARIKSLNGVRPVWYMDRSVLVKLQQQSAYAVTNSTLQISQVGGVMLTSFGGVPIKRVDALAGDEADVT